MDSKLCSECRRTKPLIKFYANKNAQDGRAWKCIDCTKAYHKRYRQEHPEQVKEWAWNNRPPEEDRKYRVQRIVSLAQTVNDIKEATPCADCGQRFPAVCMDFDHVRGEKKKDVARMVGDGYSERAIRDEMEKCDIVCANCHRLRTHASGRPKPWDDGKRKYDRSSWE